MVIKEGIGWFVVGVGFYLVFVKGFTLINLVILFSGVLGIFLNSPIKKKIGSN